MNKYLILCVDDEREVLDSVVNDLSIFEEHFIIEAASSVFEAEDILNSNPDLKLALIFCDHIMPKERGIDFLIKLNKNTNTVKSKKVLLTGQADLDDTVQAINQADLDYFIAKPWQKEELQKVAIDQLTQYIIQHDSNLISWLNILDTEKIINAISDIRQELGDN